MKNYYDIVIYLLLIFVYVVLLYFLPDHVLRLIWAGVSGWQISTWCYKLAQKISENVTGADRE